MQPGIIWKQTKSRSLNIQSWFNPPYSLNTQTNVARKFLPLIDQNFPPSNKLHKIFNRNNVKVSYSCLPNVSSIIKYHNKTVLSDQTHPDEHKCNCRKKDARSLNGNYLEKTSHLLVQCKNIRIRRRVILHRPNRELL